MCFLYRLIKLPSAPAHPADNKISPGKQRASRIAGKQNEESSAPASTYTEIYAHDPTHYIALHAYTLASPSKKQDRLVLDYTTNYVSHFAESGKALPRVFTTARGGEERRGVSPDALEAGGGYRGGRRRGGRGARLHGREASDGGAVREIWLEPPRPRNRTRSRPPFALLGRGGVGGGGGGGGVRGGRFSLVGGEARPREPRKPSRRGAQVASGPRGRESTWGLGDGRALLSDRSGALRGP